MNIEEQYKRLQKNRKTLLFKTMSYSTYKSNYIIKTKSQLRIAIIIPFREHIDSNIRFKQLKKFVIHLHHFFKQKNVKYTFFVIKQNSYKQRFNRGLLLNIGFDIAKKYQIIVTHDVDMLPDDYLLQYYLHIPKHPVHIAYPGSSVKYGYPTYIGGINIYNRDHFKKINGFPNDFWGWGGEDDAIYDRLAINNMSVIRPDKGSIKELPHQSMKGLKEFTNLKKWENRIDNIKNWKRNGLTNLKYTITKHNKKAMLHIYHIDF